MVITVPKHVYVLETPLMYVMLLTETVFVNLDGPEQLVIKVIYYIVVIYVSNVVFDRCPFGLKSLTFDTTFSHN